LKKRITKNYCGRKKRGKKKDNPTPLTRLLNVKEIWYIIFMIIWKNKDGITALCTCAFSLKL
jgi:hypothetical protein